MSMEHDTDQCPLSFSCLRNVKDCITVCLLSLTQKCPSRPSPLSFLSIWQRMWREGGPAPCRAFCPQESVVKGVAVVKPVSAGCKVTWEINRYLKYCLISYLMTLVTSFRPLWETSNYSRTVYKFRLLLLLNSSLIVAMCRWCDFISDRP